MSQEKGELVLCKENGMSTEKKNENERKEKRDDHESKKEKDDNTHGKVCIEKSKSLDELYSKVVDTTSPIEKVYVDENEKGKENYFSYVQDKAHNKKFNKAIMDLTPMRKEKRDDVIPLLHKTKYGMYNWFIHILCIPKTHEVFLEMLFANVCRLDFKRFKFEDELFSRRGEW
ncbi:hypothetical protein RDI58_026899 [Solanum bulbocastanum]|uniref:Uncharacterized protein n=1 Tax=Solanum bulbocastanum TaxID=147425 RepID=A0AAN8T176_SOLBU